MKGCNLRPIKSNTISIRLRRSGVIEFLSENRMAQVSNNLAVIKLAIALKDYDDCNPDVGMGHGKSYFVDQALSQLGLTSTDINYKVVLTLVR